MMDLPASVGHTRELPADYPTPTLGGRAALIERIKQVPPEADFSDPSWGVLRTPWFSMQFNIGDEPIDCVALHVRGGGEELTALISALLHHLGLRGIDCQTGEFYEPDAAQTSFAAWQSYRDQVVSGAPGKVERTRVLCRR